MISVEEASQLIAQHLPDWGVRQAAPGDRGSLVTTEPLVADREYPPYHRSTMDGIVLSWESFQAGQRDFPIQGIIAAGDAESALADPRAALEIMTGAPVPRNADLVIPYEMLSLENGRALVRGNSTHARFENIHRRGTDCQATEVVLPEGHAMNGPRWGIGASFGYEAVRVKREPKILVVSTGNELVDPGTTPLPHQIRRSNATSLLASLRQWGFEEVEMEHVHDDPQEIAEHYHRSTQKFDLLIYSGAVSKGKFDHLPKVWAEAGVRQVFHGVSQRPGKPLWFGVDDTHRTAIFGLPGNPISSLVCLHRYFLPRRELYAQLKEDFSFTAPLTFFLPVKIRSEKTGVLAASPAPFRNSGEFAALADTDGFLELPKGGSFRKGEGFAFYPWGRL